MDDYQLKYILIYMSSRVRGGSELKKNNKSKFNNLINTLNKKSSAAVVPNKIYNKMKKEVQDRNVWKINFNEFTKGFLEKHGDRIMKSYRKWSGKKCNGLFRERCEEQKKAVEELRRLLGIHLKVEVYEFSYGSYLHPNGNNVPQMPKIYKYRNKKYYVAGETELPRLFSQNIISNKGVSFVPIKLWEKFNQYYMDKKPRRKNPELDDIFFGNDQDISTFYDLVAKVIQMNVKRYGKSGMTNNTGFIYKWNLPPKSRVIVFGDLHGSFHSFFRSMVRLRLAGVINDDFTINDPFKILFCGDVIDRGNHALEIVYFILLLLVKNPDKIIYIRGNHEDLTTFNKDGFSKEIEMKLLTKDKRDEYSKPNTMIGQTRCVKELGKGEKKNDSSNKKGYTMCMELIGPFVRFFSSCPSATILTINNKRIWCCHGGFPVEKSDKCVEIKEKIYPIDLSRFMKSTNKTYSLTQEQTYHVRWNDFDVNCEYLAPNKRVNGKTFDIGKKCLDDFLRLNGIDFIVRGHQDNCENTVIFTKYNNKFDSFNGKILGCEEQLKGTCVFQHGVSLQSLYKDNCKNLQELTLSKMPTGTFTEMNPISVLKMKENGFDVEFEDKRSIQTDAKVITISTNDDIRRDLKADSFIVILF